MQNEITAKPTYGSCILKEGTTTFEKQIDMNGCHYLFTTTASNNFHIICPAGQQIVITAKILGALRECIAIHAQTPTVGTVDYVNETNPATGKMDVEVRIDSRRHHIRKLGLCKKAEGNEKNDTVWIGSFTLTGHNAVGEPVDVTKS